MKVLSLLLIIVMLAITLPVIAAENLLENPSFEEPTYSGKDPSGWWSWNSNYNGITSKTARTGKQAIYFTKPPDNKAQHQGIVFTYKGVKQSKEYTFSCYVKNSEKDPIKGSAYGQISIEWRKGGKEISRTWGPTWDANLSTENWKLVSMSAVAPQGVDECFFVINFFTEGGSGAYFADDVLAVER